ncbi:MAG: four-helix bundle copper-binding protein [Methylobacter sp.]
MTQQPQSQSEQAMRSSRTGHGLYAEHSMQACIEACTHCAQVCLQTAMNYCLNTGGKHVEAEHFRIMMSCAEICQTSANFQLGNSPFSNSLCAVCAEVCQACAQDCQQIGNMDECVEACQRCADSCRQMAGAQQH